MLTPAEYANISDIPYVRPLHPGVLTIPPTISERSENRRQSKQKHNLALYHETINSENALKKQITEAVNELYLEELRDATTNTILSNVTFILDHLITNYGEIEPDAVAEK